MWSEEMIDRGKATRDVKKSCHRLHIPNISSWSHATQQLAAKSHGFYNSCFSGSVTISCANQTAPTVAMGRGSPETSLRVGCCSMASRRVGHMHFGRVLRIKKKFESLLLSWEHLLAYEFHSEDVTGTENLNWIDSFSDEACRWGTGERCFILNNL